MISRRHFLSASGAAITAQAVCLPSAHAQTMDGVAKLVVGFPAGSSIDTIARRYANKLQGRYAESVIVENRPGAAGRIALEQVKRAAPDGRTMILVPVPLMTLYPHVYKKLNYDPLRDFDAVGTVYDSSMALAVGPGVPASVTTLAQFVEWAKAQSNPVFFSANAQGSGPHLLGLRFAQRAGIKLSYVAYQAGAPAMQALVSGELPFVCLSMGTLSPLAESGKIRILATCGDTRNPFYMGAPSLKELGYTDLVEYEWGGVYTPAGTPKAVLGRLESAFAEAARLPDLIEAMKKSYLTVQFRGPKETTDALKFGLERYKRIVEDSGIAVID